MKWKLLKAFLNGWLHVEEAAAKVRERAMEKAIATAPTFDEFSTFLQGYFHRRGFKVQVTMDYTNGGREAMH